MTLNQWLTCTDPAAMIDALGDQADERRKKQFVISCREHSEMCGHRHNWAIEINQLIVDDWAARPDCDVPFEIRCDLIRCLWPPPMMERERVECEECGGRGQIVEDWIDGTGASRYKCPFCEGKGYTLAPLIDPRWRTPLVMDLARQAKGGTIEHDDLILGGNVRMSGVSILEPNPEVPPILADALMDAGCDNEAILKHLRQPHHIPECWVIEAILNGGK